jgi:Ni,Fe-hydrogenase III large subunit
MDHGDMDHDDMDQGDSDHDDMDQGDLDHDDMDHEGMDHGNMDHGDMDHDDGFMSMIAMTKDLPRSRDGLPMEWVDAPFGPLFRGLPAGLAPTFTLDGDVVASVEIARLATHRDLSDSLQGPLESLPDRLAHVDPYAPIAYRILAGRAVESMTGNAVSDELASSHIGALERHRAANHLGWLADFAALLGIGWMSDRAAELHLALVRAGDIAHVTMLLAPIDTLIRRGSRVPLLKRRLAEIGTFDMESAADLQGPVAKAAGIETDSRSGEPLYQTLAFEPVLRDANDAWSRYQVRLAEISQSLDFVSALGVCSVEHTPIASNLTGSGSATIETPRGMATLHIEVNDGVVRSADVQTPSQNLVKLVPTVAEHAELADALVGIASLDISPWEVV